MPLKRVNFTKLLFDDVGESDGFSRGYGKIAGFLWSQAGRSATNGAWDAFLLCTAHRDKRLLDRHFCRNGRDLLSENPHAKDGSHPTNDTKVS